MRQRKSKRDMCVFCAHVKQLRTILRIVLKKEDGFIFIVQPKDGSHATLLFTNAEGFALKRWIRRVAAEMHPENARSPDSDAHGEEE